MTEQTVQDAILRHALDLQRLSANDEREALAIITEMEADLKRLLADIDLTDANRREIETLIAEANKLIDIRYGAVGQVVDTNEIALIVSQHTARVLEVPRPRLPTAARLASLATDVLIDGAPSSAWWARQSTDTAFQFAREVRQGVIEGATNEQIVARIVGRGDEPGILHTARRNVRTLVHSSVMTAANKARLETFRTNSKHVAGVRWLATLDSHVCLTCAALDGSAWDLEGKAIEGTTLDFQMPPAHFACRCVATPIPKSLNAILGTTGFDEAIARDQRRASSNGPTTARNFTEFLNRQTPDFINEVLGKGRADLYRAGKLTLRDLVSGSGRELTLDQLRAR